MRGYYNTGDHVFADKFSFNFRKPRRSEVFIFSTAGIPEIAKGGGPSQYYIKRLSGLPGDTLRIAAPNLYINGDKAQSAAFRRVMAGTLQNPVDGYRGYSNMLRFPLLTTPEDTYTLEPGNYFALGDNSYNSSDSRNWGPVPQRNIMGRGLFVYWPLAPTGAGSAEAVNCPICQRLLYSRRHKKCDFCGAVLPPEALLSEEEITAIKSEQDEIAKRRAADKKEEEEKRKRASRETAKTRAIFGQGN